MPKKEKDSKTAWVDPDDAPELTDAWFDAADLYQGTTRIRRGRPKKKEPAQQVTLRLPPEVLRYFGKGTKGWQTRISRALQTFADKGN